MKSPFQTKCDPLRFFSKDDAGTRLKALALMRAPAILSAVASVVSAVVLSVMTFNRFF